MWQETLVYNVQGQCVQLELKFKSNIFVRKMSKSSVVSCDDCFKNYINLCNLSRDVAKF